MSNWEELSLLFLPAPGLLLGHLDAVNQTFAAPTAPSWHLISTTPAFTEQRAVSHAPSTTQHTQDTDPCRPVHQSSLPSKFPQHPNRLNSSTWHCPLLQSIAGVSYLTACSPPQVRLDKKESQGAESRGPAPFLCCDATEELRNQTPDAKEQKAEG